MMGSDMQRPVVPDPLAAQTGVWPWCDSGDVSSMQDMVGHPDLPLITVVTPSYNQGEYLEETIRSVLLQGYPRLEYFVVDGGSTDNSGDIISHYQSLLSGAVSEPDRGQVDAINKGFARGSGDIFCWLNSDDVFEPGALFHVADAWMRCGREVMVIGGCRELFADCPDRVHWPRFQSAFDEPQALPLARVLDLKNHWLTGDFFYQPEVFFPRRLYERVNGLDESLHLALDYDLWLRMGVDGLRTVVIDKVLAGFRFHGAQKTSDRKAVLKETIAVAERYLDGDLLSLESSVTDAIRRSNRSLLRPWAALAHRATKLTRRLTHGG